METKIKVRKTTDKISSLREGLTSSIEKTNKKDIIIKFG